MYSFISRFYTDLTKIRSIVKVYPNKIILHKQETEMINSLFSIDLFRCVYLDQAINKAQPCKELLSLDLINDYCISSPNSGMLVWKVTLSFRRKEDFLFTVHQIFQCTSVQVHVFVSLYTRFSLPKHVKIYWTFEVNKMHLFSEKCQDSNYDN